MIHQLLYDKDLLDKINPEELPGFYDINLYPFLKEIENNYKIIKQEFDDVTSTKNFFQNWPQYKMTDYNPDSWQVLLLRARTNLYNQLDKISTFGEFFPNTLSILDKIVGPNLCDVVFSKLQPNARLLPHYGLFVNNLRCHLGLQIPKGDCGITVNKEIKHWEEGKILIFNEALEHAVWNQTNQERVVLIFDFIPDDYETFFPIQK